MKTPHESHQHYQLAVIGSGSGGREATLLAARKGLHSALIEGGKIGGSCFHSGCYAVRALQACATNQSISLDQIDSNVEGILIGGPADS